VRSSTRPPGTRTGLGNGKCYARALGDCVGKISAEHYVSRAVLEELGPDLLVTDGRRGFEKKPLRPANLTAKILCRRHNEALSGLDATAGSYFRALKCVGEQLVSGGGVHAFSGHDLELWLLKVLCGQTRLYGDAVPLPWVRVLFGEEEIGGRSGLNVIASIGELIPGTREVAISTARTDAGERVGCSVTMLGFRFLLALKDRPVFEREDLGKLNLWRPSHLRWTHRSTRVDYRLAFEWGDAEYGDGLQVEWTPPASPAAGT
jgi:hypothetical protein